MKIGINASFARKRHTGIGQVTLNCLSRLGRYPEITFCVYLEEELPKSIHLPNNVETRVFLPFWKRDDLIRKFLWEYFYLPAQARKDGCESFISLYQSVTILPPAVKHSMIIHDVIPEIFSEYLNNWRKRMYYYCGKRAARQADRIITISTHSEKDLIRLWNINPAKISVVYPGVDDIFQRDPSSEKNLSVLKKYNLKPGYLYAGGGFEVRKNIESLLRTYKMLKDRVKHRELGFSLPRLVLSGKLMPELAPLITDVERLIRQLNLSAEVDLLGFVEQAELPILYRNASLFIYPSLYEGFGLPVLEAMASGVPVVTSRSSSLPEVGGDAVRYYDPQNNYDLAEAIEEILSDHQTREMLRNRGLKQAQKFSWDSFVDSLINILKQNATL